jgi:hypothetical protein
MYKNTKGPGKWGGTVQQRYSLLACFIILSLLGGCAKFSASRKMDAGPFGENVTVMMGDVSADVRKPFYIKNTSMGPPGMLIRLNGIT